MSLQCNAEYHRALALTSRMVLGLVRINYAGNLNMSVGDLWRCGASSLQLMSECSSTSHALARWIHNIRKMGGYVPGRWRWTL